ncbi:hypothetical protein RJ640_016782 [Escallonia rubra]|uniref:Uncharacterized protein n=1 Tax=Escallonia rubra TaxID=112253 RepID=A0AA88UA10_9ASTE|nr:hypothetical protein RJ640_016782 [Escallonia rubra]
MENERANVRIRASEDRISALPDVLIHRIFSFLDAKFAVQSSVLSTRWERIWPSLPYLNFHRDNYRSVTRCTKFVTEFIANRDQGEGADISTFNLDLTGRTSLPFVVKIAEYAISRGVEQLSIAGSLPESHRPLPFSIFSSPYLKSLTLRIDLRVFGLSQKNWSLPALMTLNLGYMVFCEDGSKSAEPFSECVSLKSLSLICCKFSEGAKSLSLFKICSLPLSSLTISTEYPAHDRLPTKTLRWGLFSCEFMVSAPKLSSFNYGCCFPLALTIEDLHCLDKVNIHLSRVKDIAKANDSTKELVVSELLRTFQGLRNAKVVTLTTHIIEVLSFLPDLLEYQPCPFSVMKCLKLEVLHWSNTSTIPGHVMSYLLSSSPNATFVKEIEKAIYPGSMTSVGLSIVLRKRQTLTAFFMDFKKTYEELNILLPFSKDIKVQQAQREQMAVMSFLGALPPEFDTAKSQILSGTDITSLQEVFSRVLRTESTSSNQQSSVLVANRGRGSEAGRMNNNRGDRGGGDRGGHNGGTSEFVCYYCKEPGHTKRYCKKLQNRNQRAQTTTATVAATSSSSPEKTVTISVDDLPSLAFNLMSDLMTKQTIGKGHVSDGLYILDAWVPRSVACSGVVSPFEAHCRLGHPSLPVLKKLCSQFHDISSVDCESCHFAKHHRSSLSPRVNKRVEPAFELVHSDVWGPCPVLSKSGFRYFVTFVDDFSRMTWIYFMKNRSEVFAHFSAFCAEIKTQFNVHVHILRSDNAKEYMSGSFQNYMNQHGILHQSSCTDTPAQNGVAERKNRHLLETARALLFQMKVPKPFWADAISTACFLINCMPSTVLNGDVPYGVLFPTKPLFPVEPQIFGSTCFVRDVRPHLTKLDPKALKCVFLGYSRLQKGYRCYSPDLHKYLVSTNVVFCEHSPFFSSKFHSSSKGEDDDWLMYEIFPSVPIEPAISEDRTREDGLSVPVSVPVEPSNATDGANSGVAQSEDVNCLGEQAIIPSAPVKPPIVQVYSRRREHHDTCPAPAPSSSDPPPNDLDLPIGLRKVTRSKKGIFLSQRKYVLDLLVETGKAGTKPCNTPMNPSVHLTKDDGDRLDDPEKYRRLVGKLNYLIVTRPDIAYAVSTVRQFMSEPTVKHWAALEQILCYLKGAPGLGLLYSNHGHSYIECFSDADWAGSKLDRKSTTGYCVFVGGNLVSWKSKKQSVVSRSSAESEYRAMAQSTCEVMWICHLLEEISLKPPLPAKLWCDNQVARHIASNPVYHERTKHIEVQRNRVFNKLDLLMNDGKPTNRWADPPALHPKFIKTMAYIVIPGQNSSKTRNSSPNSPPPVETTVYISPGQVSVAGLSLADMQGPDQKIPMIEGSDLQSCPNEAHTSLKPPSLAQAKPAPPPKPAADLDSFFASLASFMESEELDSLAFSSHKSGGQGKYNPTSIQKAKSNLMQLLSLPLEALSRLGRTAELMDSINILLAGKCLSQDLAFKLRCLCKKLPAITKDFETAKKSSETAHSQIEARDASSKKIKECLSQYNSLKSSSTKLVDERKQNEELIEQIQARVSEIDSEALVIQAKMIQLADQAHVEEETYNAAKSEANLAAACIQRTEGEIARLEEAWAEFQDISKLV